LANPNLIDVARKPMAKKFIKPPAPDNAGGPEGETQAEPVTKPSKSARRSAKSQRAALYGSKEP
jgi:hypothetical protein